MNSGSAPAIAVRRGSLRRRLTRILVIAGFTAVTLATTATRADAANYVHGCFRYYTGTYNLGFTPAYLEAWTTTGWVVVGTLYLSSDITSCVFWGIPSGLQNFHLRMRVFYRRSAGLALFYSVPVKPAAPPGNQPYDFGTMLVYSAP